MRYNLLLSALNFALMAVNMSNEAAPWLIAFNAACGGFCLGLAAYAIAQIVVERMP